MKALICQEPGVLTLEDREAPQNDENLVKVRVNCVGVCGTDFHIFKGKHPFLEYPRVMGHELSGEVVHAPAGSALEIGAPVIFNPYIACGKCVACRRNKPNCCTNISVLGVHSDGGMCEYVNVPEKALYPADGLSMEQAAMVEFLAIGAHGVRRGSVQAGDKVLVIGAGPIGVGAGIFAHNNGADVSFLDMNENRIKTACNIVPNAKGHIASDKTLDELTAATNGDLFHVVLDATGNAKSMEASINYVCNGGTLVYVSVVKDTITFSDPLFHSREMSIIGSRNATREDFENVVQAMRDGKIPFDKLHTHSCTLDEAATQIPAWLEQSDTLIKAIVTI